MKLLSFKEFIYQEGFTIPLDDYDRTEAKKAYQEYFEGRKSQNQEFTISEEKEMQERGICENCKREDMAIMKRGNHGKMCASCRASINGLNPNDAAKALAEKAAKFAGKTKMRRAQGESSPKVPKAKKQKREKSAGAPEKTDSLGVIGNLIEQYDAALDDAELIFNTLHALKKLDFEVELPKRHIVGGQA